MDKLLNSTFLPFPDVLLSVEDAYKMLIDGTIIKIKLCVIDKDGIGFEFLFLKQHPQQEKEIILSTEKSFNNFTTFCCIESREDFLDKYRDLDIFYLKTE